MFGPDDIENDEDETSYGSRLSKRERRQKSKAKAKAEKLSIANLEAMLALLRKRAVGRRSTKARWVVIISELSTTLAVRARDAVPVAAERGCHKSRVADKAHLSAPIWVYALGI